jgi:hypothetical protein
MHSDLCEQWTDERLRSRAKELKGKEGSLNEEQLSELEDLKTEALDRFCVQENGYSPPKWPSNKLTPAELKLIRPFSGQGDPTTCWRNLNSFLHQLKTIAGPNEARQLQAGETRLRGLALAHAANNPELGTSLAAFTQGLQKRFGINLPRPVLKEIFANLKKTPCESLPTFAERIHELGRLIWPGEAPEILQGRIADTTAQFIRGLGGEELKRDLALINPKSLEDALAHALRLEHSPVVLPAERKPAPALTDEQGEGHREINDIKEIGQNPGPDSCASQKGQTPKRKKRGRPTLRSTRYRLGSPSITSSEASEMNRE